MQQAKSKEAITPIYRIFFSLKSQKKQMKAFVRSVFPIIISFNFKPRKTDQQPTHKFERNLPIIQNSR